MLRNTIANLEKILDLSELIPGFGTIKVIYNFENERDTFAIRQDETFQEAYKKSITFAVYHMVSLISLSAMIYSIYESVR